MTQGLLLDLVSWWTPLIYIENCLFCYASIMILHSYFIVQEEAISGSRVEEISLALYSSSSTSSEQLFSLNIGEIKVNIELKQV